MLLTFFPIYRARHQKILVPIGLVAKDFLSHQKILVPEGPVAKEVFNKFSILKTAISLSNGVIICPLNFKASSTMCTINKKWKKHNKKDSGNRTEVEWTDVCTTDSRKDTYVTI